MSDARRIPRSLYQIYGSDVRLCWNTTPSVNGLKISFCPHCACTWHIPHRQHIQHKTIVNSRCKSGSVLLGTEQPDPVDCNEFESQLGIGLLRNVAANCCPHPQVTESRTNCHGGYQRFWGSCGSSLICPPAVQKSENQSSQTIPGGIQPVWQHDRYIFEQQIKKPTC